MRAGSSLRPSHTLAIELWAEIGRDSALARRLRPIHRRTIAKLEEVARALSDPQFDRGAVARVLRSLHLGLLVQTVLEPGIDVAAYAEATTEVIRSFLLRRRDSSARSRRR